MPRNSDETRRRLLEAAIAEFAQFGMAGGRVDRIAEAAQVNKQAIYAYFSSKEGLFDAVFDAIVLQTLEAVPIDRTTCRVRRSFVRSYGQHPEILRIATWYALERGNGAPHPSALRSAENKIAAIREAQAAGAITKAFAPEDLLMLLLNISRAGSADSPSSMGPERLPETMKRSIIEAVRRVTVP